MTASIQNLIVFHRAFKERFTLFENKSEFLYSKLSWITGIVQTAAGNIPVVNTQLSSADKMGAWKARLGIGRMNYRVEPGLYAVGSPTNESPVLVSANYKLSFDHLRSKLGEHDAWIMVLDTKGINVWCAAGEGTFGTEEIVKRISIIHLSDIVSHRNLVLPQLGAPGIRAHEVWRMSGFRVVYGPVRAQDLPLFLDNGMKTTLEMRRIRFTFSDRAVLIPVELVMSLKYVSGIALFFLLFSGLGEGGYSFERIISHGAGSSILFMSVWVAGVVFTPLFLPWLPGRAFSSKGGWTGIVCILFIGIYSLIFPGMFENKTSMIAWLFIIPAVTSFTGMNFTGASTYTSLSGVKREMSIALPVQVLFAIIGIALWLTGRFV